jgi:signal transduction histidine kinase
MFQKRDSGWSIVVRDTGIGIPEERLPYVFEPFRRGSDYATRQHQGAGLGLSIVKTLVTLMSGKVEVESSIGAGSVFTVTLPLTKGMEE